MTKNTIEVVALVVDSGILSFYKTDGSVFTVTQGDPLGPIMSEEFLLQRQQGKEVIELKIEADDPVFTHLSHKNRNPLIKFFRARLTDVKKFFGAETDFSVEGAEASHEAAAQRVRDMAAKLFKTNESGVHTENAELPVKLVTAEEGPITEEETIIAVTEDGIVPEMEALSGQFQASDAGTASATGPDNLILRLSKMSAKRAHTANELINFIKGIDLPILPDGSFLAYKRLIHQGRGVYVDPHSRRVFQRIGDTVQMDEKLVNPDRRQLCSTGLHVGSRSYMGGFHGNSEGSGTMLVLVQPEDAIAVPHRQASKGRMMRYTILADLSNKAHDLVNQNKRMDDCKETMQIVSQIVAGGRPPMLGVVNIADSGGGGLTYTINGVDQRTNLSLEEARTVAQTKATAPSGAVTAVKTIDETVNGNKKTMNPEKIRTKEAVVKPAEAKAKAVAQAPVAGASERTKKAAELYARMTDKANSDADRRTAAQELKAFKTKAKVGYPVLGLPANAGDEIQEILVIVSKPKPPVAPVSKPMPKKAEPAKKAAPQPVKPAPVPSISKKQTEPKKQAPQPKVKAKPAPKPAPKTAPVQEEPKAAPKDETRQAKARRLWDNLTNTNLTGNHRKQAADELQKFKKAAKSSWTALGLGDKNVEAELKKLLG